MCIIHSLSITFLFWMSLPRETITSEFLPDPVGFCSSNPTYSTPYYSTSCTVGTTAVKSSQPECDTWEVQVLMLFRESPSTYDYLRAVGSFIETITDGCNSSSYLRVYDTLTNSSCPVQQNIGVALEPDYISKLNYSSVVPPFNVIPGDVMYYMLELLKSCTTSQNRNQTRGASLFIFTNFDCDSYCSSEELTKTNMDIIQGLLQMNYNIRILYTATDKNTLCFDKLFPTCDAPYCQVIWNKDPSSYKQLATEMITCPEKANNNNNNSGSNSNLVLAITLPIVCTIIVSAIVAVICLRRQKNQKNRFSGFLKHLRGQTNSQKMWSIHRKQNDFMGAEDPDSLHRWEIPAKCLDFGGNRLIGSGAFSKVYKATISGRIPLLDMNQSLNLLSEHFQGGKYEVAVKRLPPHANQQNRADFFQEIEFMKTLGYHSHVISLIACVSDSFDPLIVVQYCANGDLLKYIRKNKTNFISDSSIEENTEGALRSKDLLSIAWQISDGMDFLSTNNVVHRDLAARNILLTGNMVAKVADFGMCRYANEELYTSRRGRMPIKWMAPESLQYYEYSTKTDVWSFSILLFELYTLGEGPFQGIEPIEMVPHLKAGNRLSKPEYCSEEIFDLMKKCWAEVPSDRPNFHEVKEDLSCLMNSNDQHYGYLTLNDDEVATTDEMEEEPEKQITPPNNSTGEHTESCLI